MNTFEFIKFGKYDANSSAVTAAQHCDDEAADLPQFRNSYRIIKAYGEGGNQLRHFPQNNTLGQTAWCEYECTKYYIVYFDEATQHVFSARQSTRIRR